MKVLTVIVAIYRLNNKIIKMVNCKKENKMYFYTISLIKS